LSKRDRSSGGSGDSRLCEAKMAEKPFRILYGSPQATRTRKAHPFTKLCEGAESLLNRHLSIMTFISYFIFHKTRNTLPHRHKPNPHQQKQRELSSRAKMAEKPFRILYGSPQATRTRKAHPFTKLCEGAAPLMNIT